MKINKALAILLSTTCITSLNTSYAYGADVNLKYDLEKRGKDYDNNSVMLKIGFNF